MFGDTLLITSLCECKHYPRRLLNYFVTYWKKIRKEETVNNFLRILQAIG